MDGHYLCAHGPSQGVKYLGIFGLEKSIGLALVTHQPRRPCALRHCQSYRSHNSSQRDRRRNT